MNAIGASSDFRQNGTDAIGKLFTGEKGSMPINEWLDRFETLALAKGWDSEQRANKLIAMTSMGAYTVLRKGVVDGMSAEDKLKLFKETLLKTFGATPEKAFALACARKFNPSSEDIDAFASDITQLVSTEP